MEFRRVLFRSRLPGYPGAHELPWGFHQIGTSDQLPGLAEHCQALKFRDARIDVPRSGNGGGLRKRRALVVAGKNLLQGSLHGRKTLSASSVILNLRFVPRDRAIK